MKGVVTVAALDADAHQSLAQVLCALDNAVRIRDMYELCFDDSLPCSRC